MCWLLSDPGPIPDIDDVERFGRDGPNADIRHVRAQRSADAEIRPSVWPPNGRRSPGKIARRQWPLGAGLSCFARERTSAIVRHEKFQELPVLGIPGISESAFDGWALGRRRQRAHDRRVGRGQRRPRGDDIRYAAVVDDLSAANVLSRIAASRHLSEHWSGHHAWLPPPPAPSLIWTGAGRRDMGRVQ